MGRNLLRRTGIAFFLVTGFTAVPLAAAPAGTPPLPAETIPATAYVDAHAGAGGSAATFGDAASAAPGTLPVETPASQFEDRSLRRAVSGSSWPEPADGPSPLPSRQTHAGPVVFPLEVRPDALLSRYLSHFRSPAGLRWIEAALQRGRPYREFIRSRLREAHLPPELYYLAMIESTYVVHAVSRSGAVGMWQFMRNSIGDSMAVTEFVDERRDFWRSTEAAVDKLAYNHAVLGDWLLAIAAYNGGLGYISRLVQRTGIHDFWQLERGGYLTPETAAYVPKFLAVAAVADYAGRHGIERSWAPPTEWVRIQVSGPVDLGLLAEQAGIPMGLLATANAELNYAITPPGGYQIKVPKRYAESAMRVISSSGVDLVRLYRHTIRMGDTFWELARRYQVPVTLLQQFNPDLDPASLRPGDLLEVPVLAGAPDPAQLDATASDRKVAAASRTQWSEQRYTVERGDTLFSISRAYGITPEQLAAANGLSVRAPLAVGRVLNVPAPSSEE
ncbi:LysM peptidoglycan-binding domain-containing protein [Salinispira pacifica]